MYATFGIRTHFSATSNDFSIFTLFGFLIAFLFHYSLFPRRKLLVPHFSFIFIFFLGVLWEFKYAGGVKSQAPASYNNRIFTEPGESKYTGGVTISQENPGSLYILV